MTLLLPFPAATTPDLVARILSEGLAAELGQGVIVDNKGGAGGIIGTQLVAGAPPDGYELLMGSVSTHAVNPWLYKKLPYDPVRDFDPVVLLTKAPNTVLVSNDLPVKTLRDFILYCKAHPGAVSYGSSGNGTSQHLAGELFKKMAGIDIVHVPYKGGAQAMTDLRAGVVQAMFEVLPGALGPIKGNSVRILAVASNQRLPVIASVPTVAEAGLPGYEVTTWHGLFAPHGTPKATIQRLNAAISKVMNQQPYKGKINDLGAIVATGAPADFSAFIAGERKRWGEIVLSSGATVD